MSRSVRPSVTFAPSTYNDGSQLKSQSASQRSSQRTTQRNSQSGRTRDCPPGKVLNPFSNRCVTEGGQAYKSMMRESGMNGIFVPQRTMTAKNHTQRQTVQPTFRANPTYSQSKSSSMRNSARQTSSGQAFSVPSNRVQYTVHPSRLTQYREPVVFEEDEEVDEDFDNDASSSDEGSEDEYQQDITTFVPFPLPVKRSSPNSWRSSGSIPPSPPSLPYNSFQRSSMRNSIPPPPPSFQRSSPRSNSRSSPRSSPRSSFGSSPRNSPRNSLPSPPSSTRSSQERVSVEQPEDQEYYSDDDQEDYETPSQPSMISRLTAGLSSLWREDRY